MFFISAGSCEFAQIFVILIIFYANFYVLIAIILIQIDTQGIRFKWFINFLFDCWNLVSLNSMLIK